MKKLLLGFITVGLLSSAVYAKKVEQTICFAKSSCTDKYGYATLGQEVALCGGSCKGKTLTQMNKKGWKLIQVVGGLNSGFGMLLTKEK